MEIDLGALYNERSQALTARHNAYNIIDAAIRGQLPRQYEELFYEGEVKLEVRTIQNADHNLTRLASKVFPIAVDKLGKRDSDSAERAAERVEKVAYGWYNGSALRRGPEMDALAFQFARDQVRFFDGCMLINYDWDRKLVFYSRVDPRNHFPPNGWTPWGQTPLDNTLIVTEMTLGEVKARYADGDKYLTTRLNNTFDKKVSTSKNDYVTDDGQKIKIGMFRSRKYWCVSAIGSTQSINLVESSESDYGHPGVTGVVSFQNFETEPLFMGQVGIEAALMKVINQEIQGTQAMLTGPIFGPRVVGDEVNWTGYNVIDPTDTRAFTPQRLAPQSPLGLERAFQTLMALSQLHNYNPPSLAGTGEANSGKALQQLHAGPSSIVQDILWKPFKNGWPRAFDDSAEMEMTLWPNEKKKAIGTKGKQAFEVDYVPITHLKDFLGRIKIEEGFGLGGYTQVLEGMQLVQAGLMPREQFLEMHPGVKDVAGWLRQLDSNELSKFSDAAFEAVASQDPRTALKAIAEINQRVNKGMSKFDAIQEVVNAGLLDPPAPEAPAGGIPPELAARLGGGGQPELPAAPSLSAARGF